MEWRGSCSSKRCERGQPAVEDASAWLPFDVHRRKCKAWATSASPHSDQSWLPCLPGLPPNPVRHSCVVVTSGCCSCMLPLFAIRHKRVPASGTAGRQQERKERKGRKESASVDMQAGMLQKNVAEGWKRMGGEMGLLSTNNKRLAASAGGEARRRAGKESSAGGHSGRRALLAPGWRYWMQQRQPDWLCSHSSSLRVEQRPTEGSYSTTWARGDCPSKSVQLTLRGKRAEPLAAAEPRRAPLGRFSKPPPLAAAAPAAADGPERRSAAASKGDVKVKGPSASLLALGTRGREPPPPPAAAWGLAGAANPAAAAAAAAPPSAAAASAAGGLGLGRGGKLPAAGGDGAAAAAAFTPVGSASAAAAGAATGTGTGTASDVGGTGTVMAAVIDCCRCCSQEWGLCSLSEAKERI